MSFNLNSLLRENIKKLVPYSSARNEFEGEATVFLDANENAFGSPTANPYHRYPDPMQRELKKKLSEIKGVPQPNMFLGNGSDEAIDLMFRAFCKPGLDNVILVPPTYGMYEVSANINDVETRKVPLNQEFQLDLHGIADQLDRHTKLIFICSPNNPTGNSINPLDIETLLINFKGIVVIDEAYINYAKQASFTHQLAEFPNLVILQTLSKAWGLAALRLGLAFAHREIIEVLNKIKPPYNISQAAQELVLQALQNVDQVNHWIKETVSQREYLTRSLSERPYVSTIIPSDANFILVRFEHARQLYTYLVSKGIIVRDRSTMTGCEDMLRLTVGTPLENESLLEEIGNFYKKMNGE